MGQPRVTECGDLITISLISHVAKIVLRVGLLLERSRSRTRNKIAEEKYGFKKTVDADMQYLY